jgi:pimeloyl-ACP methyl ester carboxylesterase
MEPHFAPENAVRRAGDEAQTALGQFQLLMESATRHSARMGQEHAERARDWTTKFWQTCDQMREALTRGTGPEMASAYMTDAMQRSVLFWNAMMERGNIDIAHEEAGTPPVLVYDYEVILDGKTLKRPVNYFLIRIIPPKGVEIDPTKQPFVIVDPRAGHGAGIGGFKQDSQVGVALAKGHPVYFVAFRPHPEAGQTLADVTKAEATFVREVGRRHPDAPKPIVVGNCQGGWATLLLAAANPDLTGPVVINGAPVSTWAGRVGENPMRYNGGLLGGVVPAMLLSDLGHGEFDGAYLVSNFEALNPSRNFWGKYYDLYDNIDKGKSRFLDFERWWGGFHFMTEAEIRWIVSQLFVGNLLARNEASLEPGRHLDLKSIRSPIIVFASWGDNITPPQQALNWITDAYPDEDEIRIRGQRIIYMIHEKVGHLGIFVSATVAQKEHTEVAGTLEMISALAPGLYEMRIEEETGEGADAHFVVSFHQRSLQDIRALDDGSRRENAAFAAVERMSELNGELYDLFARPLVQSMVTAQTAKLIRDVNPIRVQRVAVSDRNPYLKHLPALARQVEEQRKPLSADHPLREMERLGSKYIEQTMDIAKDWRDALYELSFLSIYASPAMQFVGRRFNFSRTQKDPQELEFLPEVQAMLLNADRGGYAEAVIRMLIVLAQARGSVRRSRLERSAHVLTQDEPFASMSTAQRAALIHEQSVIVEFARELSITSLPKLLERTEERERAIATVEYIAGPIDEMEPHTIQAIETFRRELGLPEVIAQPRSTPAPAKVLGRSRRSSPSAA